MSRHTIASQDVTFGASQSRITEPWTRDDGCWTLDTGLVTTLHVNLHFEPLMHAGDLWLPFCQHPVTGQFKFTMDQLSLNQFSHVWRVAGIEGPGSAARGQPLRPSGRRTYIKNKSTHLAITNGRHTMKLL